MNLQDPVTGAQSRAALDDALHAVGGASLLLFDVDHFKTVNDAFGHLRGDMLLRQLAERIQGLIRGGDVLFRYGGDEFVLLLPRTAPDEALRLAIRLTDEIRAREFPGTPPLHLSISMGVASSPADGDDGETLIAAADRRNYLAKRRGRGQAVGDDAEADPAAGSSRLWERDGALSTTQEFMTRVSAGLRGALRIAGPKGAGHTRFLREVAQIAHLRGFQTAISGGTANASTRPKILLADVGDPIPALGDAVALVYASTDLDASARTDLPESVVELTPWSPATLRIWLRIALAGEPTRALLDRLVERSGGLPARAEAELQRLRAQGELVAAGDGTWGVKPAAPKRRRTRLPVPMTRLVGRDRETARVAALIRDGRLVTLVGPGGIGKTRLSLAAAGAVADEFADGAVFVPLADTTDAELLTAALARALHVTELPGQHLFDTVLDQLAEAEQLLVLDNFEQVVDDGAALVSDLLAAAPGVRALVTSRERLSLYGEQVYQVPTLADSPAVTLFEQRARAVDADFEITIDTALPVAQLCRRLDGLPLAIELAAARIDRWSPDELLDHLTEHLDRELDTLGGTGPRDLPARQQTLRGAIDWSFVLLDAEEQRLMTELSVFVGGWTGAAALAVTGPSGDLDLLEKRLAALVDKHLVVRDDDTGRYHLLSTIRAYARNRLGDEPAPAARHADFYAAFAESSAVGLTGPDQAEWTGRIEADYENVRAAFSHGDGPTRTRICLGLWRYWRNGAHIAEGRDWLAQVLAMEPPAPSSSPSFPPAHSAGSATRASGGDGPAVGGAAAGVASGGADPGVRAKLLHAAAILAAGQDEHEAAYRLGAESLERATAAGDRATIGHAHNAMGIAAIGGGDHAAATAHFGESLAVWRELDVPQGVAASLGNLSKVALSRNDHEAAETYARECLDLERAGGNTRGILLALECVGQALLGQGDVPGARAALDESLTLSRQIGDAFGAAMAQHALGLAALAEGDRAEALRLLVAALVTRHEVGDRLDLAISLDVVASLLAPDDPAHAARLLGAADALRARHRLPEPPDAQTLRSQTLPRTADQQRDRAAGRAVSLDHIVEHVAHLSG
ncbi:diguanylate cyclase [Dactylosporangium vinaceum]|uniref:Diguanylate cyclase n=1 Tax=Dactylosporangium vinaceum TaxID=53362 RepID=A0ABV5M1B9_9ACTN|nr:diguanylate cyclase [Dactylosporangium vinaceum]UAB97152.1 diguanylate cyclase [Dactylosporangium vinaceum]